MNCYGATGHLRRLRYIVGQEPSRRMPSKGKQGTEDSGQFEALPEELSEFLSKGTYSLLLKGDSGTGKTILALSILKALQPIENLLYLSTRTSPLQLMENYPWIEDVFGSASPQANADGWETLVDSRLDEPNVVFERITNVLMDRQAPTLVIDSWESLADTLGSEALRTNIRVLQTWRERAGARFIFVGEDPSNTTIDFMVEGVIVLKDRVQQGRRLRELLFSKLHGVPIRRPSYYFSLHEGVFTSLPYYSPGDYDFRSSLPVTLDRPFRRIKGRYPTGYSALDSHLEGGYPSNSTVLLELDRGVDSRVGLVFVSRTVQDWVTAGDRVVVEKPLDVDKDFMRMYVKSFGRDAGPRLVVVDPLSKRGGVHEESVMKKGRRETHKTLAIRAATNAEEGLEKSTLGVPGETLARADLSIVIQKSREDGAGKTNAASILLRLFDIDGTLFFECETPRSPLFGVIPSRTAGNPTIALEPVV
jgi:KaiC/GvpD/RAD55 family RecA-like ATPase